MKKPLLLILLLVCGCDKPLTLDQMLKTEADRDARLVGCVKVCGEGRVLKASLSDWNGMLECECECVK